MFAIPKNTLFHLRFNTAIAVTLALGCGCLGGDHAGAIDDRTPAQGDDQERRSLELPIKTALDRAGNNRAAIQQAIDDVPADQKKGMLFLIENMPPRDLQTLSAEFLLQNVRLAYQARQDTDWTASVPEDVFLNCVLPYASVNEKRDPWRQRLREISLPIVNDADTLSQAATRLNQQLFGKLGVKYSTQRARADQGPFQSIESGLASCTGLSILLIDACRSVGIPARFVGTPMWSNGSGNHSWVEIWDNGWHFTGAAEPTGDSLNRGWFVDNASKAIADQKRHAIFASSFRRTPTAFPLIWAPHIQDVWAVNVTERYIASRQPLPSNHGLAKLEIRNHDGTRAAVAVEVLLDDQPVFTGKSRDEGFDTNDHLSVVLKQNTDYSVRIGQKNDERELQLTSDEQVFVFHLDSAATAVDAESDPPETAKLSRRAVQDLKAWLVKQTDLPLNVQDQPFARVPLTADDTAAARTAMDKRRQIILRKQRSAEMKAGQIVIGQHQLRFSSTRFGKKPADGWSLYLSMHGGGATTSQGNDKQWRNQKKLYRLEEGIYVAPRAPTDTWNLWHQDHIDPLFDRLIENMVAIEDVNWNRVYLTGYSAGGDGVYQLASRMSDRWAAAAMMAGHPNETTPVGLRNVPFALMMGGNDAAYDRNKIAKRWETQLSTLQSDDPGGYDHFVQIFPSLGHWMDRKDAVAIPWMAKHTRNPLPKKLVWKQDDVLHDQSYWLAVNRNHRKPGSLIRAEVNGQTISVTNPSSNQAGVAQVIVQLDDRFIDLDQPVTIRFGGVDVFQGRVNRTIAELAETLNRRGDPNLSFPARVTLESP